MARVTIYLDDETIGRVERAAKQSGSSVSAWIKQRLQESLDQGWPTGYFDLFGQLADTDLERPPQPDPGADTGRHPACVWRRAR